MHAKRFEFSFDDIFHFIYLHLFIFLIYLHFLWQEPPERDDDTISIEKITEVDESKTDEINTKFSSYLAEGTETGQRPPFYCKELGFAMEKIKDGFTLKDLWEVIPTTN